MSKSVKLDHGGIAAVLKSTESHRMVQEAAEKVADEIRGQGIEVGAFKGAGKIPLPVKVEVTTTDRAHASVVIAHPAGVAVQAKHGAVTRGASSAGLSIH